MIRLHVLKEACMAKALVLRADYDALVLRRLAKASRDADQTRRLLALASIYDGSSRGGAADLAAVTRQIVRDWVERFNAEGPDGLISRKAPGTPPRLNDMHRAALAKAVDDGPTPWRDGVVRWRLVDLVAWMHETFNVSSSEDILGRELRAMGYRRLTARPRHPGHDHDAAEAFKKTSPARSAISEKKWGKSPSKSGSKTKPG
jgi:transposase